ncbi:MAG TPA: Flp family type IVb pilin [Rhizomicrobium sp.]|jgi:Flp pilus assembly pilin Flp
MNKLLSRFLVEESGVTAIEYGLDCRPPRRRHHRRGSAVGTNLSNTFSTVANSL